MQQRVWYEPSTLAESDREGHTAELGFCGGRIEIFS